MVILGAGGFAREVFWWLRQSADYNISCFYDEYAKDDPYPVYYTPKISSFQGLSGANYLAAIGDPSVRRRLTVEADRYGLIASTCVVHPSAMIGGNVYSSEGTIICPGVILTADIVVGYHCILNIGCTIGHDSHIGDFVTVNPGVNISGNVIVGENTTIGTNASIRDKIKIGKNCIIGAGAVVVSDVPDNSIYVGNPARQMTRKTDNISSVVQLKIAKDEGSET